MSWCLGWFGVRGVDAARVIDTLHATCSSARRDDVPEIFRVFDNVVSSKPRAAWAEVAPRWSLVLLEGSGSQYDVPAHSAPSWAQAVSQRLGVPTMSFFLLEGGWSYAVFENGREAVAQETYILPVPQVYGDRARAAQLLGVDASVFDQYERALQEGREEPFDGDEFAPTDEWGHTDFARHFDLVYPADPTGGVVYRPTASEIASAGIQWKGLAPRLDMPEPPPHPAAKGEIDFGKFPSGDDPF